MPDRTEFDAAMAAGAALKASDDDFVFIPEGYKIEDMERFRDRPRHIRAGHRFVALDSLATYLDRFATADTMIEADYAKGTISAVIDGDAPDAPSHRTHRAAFSAVMDDRVRAWLGLEGKPLTQTQFALFLEDRAVDVTEPDAGSVMDMVIGFEATKKVTFQSSIRLSNGSRQMVYKDDTEQRGALTLPDRFILLAPIYRGMEPQRITFIVRYRIEDGALRFSVQMHDKVSVLREAFDRCVDALRSGLKLDLPIYVTG